jgi:hypothetical protein
MSGRTTAQTKVPLTPGVQEGNASPCCTQVNSRGGAGQAAHLHEQLRVLTELLVQLCQLPVRDWALGGLLLHCHLAMLAAQPSLPNLLQTQHRQQRCHVEQGCVRWQTQAFGARGYRAPASDIVLDWR